MFLFLLEGLWEPPSQQDSSVVLIIFMNSKVSTFFILQVEKHVYMRERKKMVSLVWAAHSKDTDRDRRPYRKSNVFWHVVSLL